MEKTRDLFKKIRDTKETFHDKMDSIKDRNGVDLTEAEEVARVHRRLYKKDLHDPDNHDDAHQVAKVLELRQVLPMNIQG